MQQFPDTEALRCARLGGRRPSTVARSLRPAAATADDSMLNSCGYLPFALALGKSLGMSTTAEGVETREQLELLRVEGCSEAQGYLFSRAVPAADVPLLLNTRSTAA
ncbi:MAG: EAL domain-containing protein [Bradyrhizobium sp.]|nr:EAL domain-containing protein [Bradyrhizobium sp.]